jgi:VWFA-related protein
MRLFCPLFVLASVILAAQSQNTAELSSHDEPAVFKSRVNLVTVPVVVRDGQGHAVGNLHKEDFQLFDKGKVQVISRFSMETPGHPSATPTAESVDAAGSTTAQTETNGPAPVIPQRYVAYLFDDVHTDYADLVRARDGADRHILSTLSPIDRAAIFTTSGQGNLDFTEDRQKLHDALLKLRPRPITRTSTTSCPNITYYMADIVVNQNDPQLMQALTMETVACEGLTGQGAAQMAQSTVQSTANQVLQAGNQETHVTYTVLSDVVRRISGMPGQRMIILASPGFLTLADERYEESQVIERAVHSNVIINALDARGLYTVSPMGDISQPTYDSQASSIKSRYVLAEASVTSSVLAELADGTGGTFVQNTNDLTGAFGRLGSPPEYIYVLGFSPQNLKVDGSFHRLKVTLKPGMKLTLQARRGYYAPKHAVDPAEAAKQEISDALFSQEEVRDLPVQLHTQFFKSSDVDAKLSVLAHLDLKGMQFRKADGRNNDQLTIVAGLFDNNGNFLKGSEKTLTLRLLDQTLASHLQSGVTVRTSFDVKPGTYLVRLVVRENEGQQMAAQSGSVEIP